MIAQSQAIDAPSQAVLALSFSHDEQAGGHLAPATGDGVDEQFVILLACQPADGDDDATAVLAVEEPMGHGLVSQG